MDEFELIRLLTGRLSTRPEVVVGPGDDCAVLHLAGSGTELLLKSDAVVEDVHFLKTDPPEKVGHKAMGRVLSDVAAMAGTPVAALVTLGLSEGFDPARVEGLYRGLEELGHRFGVAIVGGETTRVPQGLILSIALLGTVAPGRFITRKGAAAGDAIFVTGELGGSLEGRHLEFEPRVEEGRWLASEFDIHAMIDLSDGLAGDLRHLLAPCRLGAEVRADAIPISMAARRRARELSGAKPPLLAALTDGEDFELLFALSSRDAVPLLDAWKVRFPGLKLSCIGRINAAPGVTLLDKGVIKPFPTHGYTHFKQQP